MKILFLDHDGVICLYKNWGTRYNSTNELFDSFDKGAVTVLNDIIQKTDCEIVVSSDWRLYESLENMQKLYQKRGIIKVPIAYTPYLYSRLKSEIQRVSEIITWVEQNQPELWVAVDDMNLRELGEEHFVQTPKGKEGIKQCGLKDKILKRLGYESK